MTRWLRRPYMHGVLLEMEAGLIVTGFFSALATLAAAMWFFPLVDRAMLILVFAASLLFALLTVRRTVLDMWASFREDRKEEERKLAREVMES